ncbi:MAG TPA: methyltransferase domain-containing protein [Phycisphaerae bacterium]|nr:methyltransferase domain-containing protein [Phycisphaerae bacterium]
MKSINGINLSNVQAVYDGPEGDLWELVMGQQIHIGGFVSSSDLADKAGIEPDSKGIDLCCCNGAGMRFLVRFRQVSSMIGVDASETVISRGQQRCVDENFSDRIRFEQADVCNCPLPDGEADFVWGEDAWCYVTDKPTLIAEAARLVRPGGTIAFTDWVEGPAGLDDAEAERFMQFMKFPTLASICDYSKLLIDNGCEIILAEDTGRFAPYVDLYLDMLNKQLTFDALRIIGYDMELMAGLGGEMVNMQELAHAGKIAQGLFVARKKA